MSWHDDARLIVEIGLSSYLVWWITQRLEKKIDMVIEAIADLK